MDAFPPPLSTSSSPSSRQNFLHIISSLYIRVYIYVSDLVDMNIRIKTSPEKNEAKNTESGSSSTSPSTSPTRQFLRDTWKSLTRRRTSGAKKQRSLPDLFQRKSSASPPRASSPEPPRRPADVEDSQFGDALMGLLKRNEKYHHLLCESTLKDAAIEKEQESTQKEKDKSRRKSTADYNSSRF